MTPPCIWTWGSRKNIARWSSYETYPCIHSANITLCLSSARPTWATYRTGRSLGCPSWPGSWRVTPAAPAPGAPHDPGRRNYPREVGRSWRHLRRGGRTPVHDDEGRAEAGERDRHQRGAWCTYARAPRTRQEAMSLTTGHR